MSLFPEQCWKSDPEELLRLSDEPKLSALSCLEAYRFFKLGRTISVLTNVAIRIERTPTSLTLTAKTVSAPRSDIDPWTLHTSKDISDADWRSVVADVAASEFWEMQSGPDDDGGSDGSDFVIEGLRDGRYQIIHRWNELHPNLHTAFNRANELAELDSLGRP